MGGDEGVNLVIPGRRQGARRAVPTCASGSTATRRRSSPCWRAIRGWRRSRSSSTATIPSAWTTSRARRSAMAAAARRMWRAIEAVKKGEADFAVSAGNTGALMAMARFCLRTTAEIDRPAIAALWPTLRGRERRARLRRDDRRRRAAALRFRRDGRRDGAGAVRHPAADRRPPQYRRRGGQGPRAGPGGRPAPRGRPTCPTSTISASSRATISARARSTSS